MKIKLGVIFGGASTEHEVSVVSGTSIIKNLNKEKYDIYPIYIDRSGNWNKYKKEVNEIDILGINQKVEPLEKIENPMEYMQKLDVVFPALHGLYGEDGAIQGLFEIINKKYVGCKILSSSVCMDKVYTKIILDKAKIVQAKYMYIKKYSDKYVYVDEQFEEQNCNINEIVDIVKEKLGFPVFVKPSNSGSSVGINKSHNEKELIEHIKYAGKFDTKILVEEEIKGKEVECAVLGNNEIEASGVGEILPAEEFYTFDAKYNNSESKTLIPANISEETTEEIRRTAIKAFKAVDGKGLARIDFFVEEKTNKIILNEINTLPGFTKISMYPKLWEAKGISYSQLLDRLINLAME